MPDTGWLAEGPTGAGRSCHCLTVVSAVHLELVVRVTRPGAWQAPAGHSGVASDGKPRAREAPREGWAGRLASGTGSPGP